MYYDDAAKLEVETAPSHRLVVLESRLAALQLALEALHIAVENLAKTIEERR